MQKLTLLSLIIGVAGCAAQPTGPDPAIVRFDGVYRGTQTSTLSGAECPAVSRSVAYNVAEGRIVFHRHSRHGRLEGTVDAQGNVAMEDGRGTHQLFGTILNGHLTALETYGAPVDRNGAYAPTAAQGVCTLQIDAVRSGTAATGQGDPEDQ